LKVLLHPKSDNNYSDELGNLDTLGGDIVGWLCKTQGSVTLSSTEAEYISASTGAQNIVF
jgi:hypothetical protein